MTGQDIVSTLKQQKKLGKILLIAENMLKCGEEVFLDDYTLDQLKNELDMPVLVMPNEGQEWLEKILHAKGETK